MAGRQELDLALGYPSTGVLPTGTSDIHVLMEDGLLSSSTVLVGSGEVAVGIEMRPDELKVVTHTIVLPPSL